MRYNLALYETKLPSAKVGGLYMKTKLKRSPGRKEIELISGGNWAPIPDRQEEGLSKLPEAFYSEIARYVFGVLLEVKLNE